MHITLTGNLGSGKSTICKLLEKNNGFDIYSTGKIQRQLAEEMGISVLEMNQLMCTDSKYDNMIDDATRRISSENKGRNIVFDSRLAWNFVEESFKVFLTVSLSEAAKRVFNDNRGAVETYHSIDEAKEQLRLRAETEDKRYKDIYKLNYFDFSNYNLILDSTCCPPGLLAKILFSEATDYYNKNGYYLDHKTKILMSPSRLGFPPSGHYVAKAPFYPEQAIAISPDHEDFFVSDGKEIVEEASKKGFSHVISVIL